MFGLRLTPHPRKSQAMLISVSSFIGPIAAVLIGNSFLSRVQKSRLLGVTVDGAQHLSEVKKGFDSLS